LARGSDTDHRRDFAREKMKPLLDEVADEFDRFEFSIAIVPAPGAAQGRSRPIARVSISLGRCPDVNVT
jgi:hypothetical protein